MLQKGLNSACVGAAWWLYPVWGSLKLSHEKREIGCLIYSVASLQCAKITLAHSCFLQQFLKINVGIADETSFSVDLHALNTSGLNFCNQG